MKKLLFITYVMLLHNTLYAQHSFTRNKSAVKYRNDYVRMTCMRNDIFEIRNGRLYGWGANGIAELGLGNFTEYDSPIQSGTDSNWINVSISLGQFTLAIKSDGTLWAWGYNNYGQLGIGNTNIQTLAVQVGNDQDWTKIFSAASGHSLAIKADGSLWSWGRNLDGQLGLGDTVNRHAPTQVGNEHNWVAIGGGVNCSWALKADGSLWTWGANDDGQLGLGDTLQRYSPVQVGNSNKWVQVPYSCNSFLGIQADGSLWGWGANGSGNLGLGDTADRWNPTRIGSEKDWVWVESGGNSMALKSNGQLWGWGDDEGALGLGYDDTNIWKLPILINNSNDWVSISAVQKTYALKAGGSIWATGLNDVGQMGLGYANWNPIDTYTATSTPALEWISGATGGNHTLALYSDGTIWSWGDNANGQLGTGNTTEVHAPVQVGSDTAWVALMAGTAHSLAMKSDGSIWAWGRNSSGELGTGNNTEQHSPVQVSGTWASIAAGDAHSMALKADGSLWTWGNNNTGQLGLGNYTNQNSPTQVGQDSIWIAIAAGEGHSLGLKADGTLWAWGLNLYGQLGTGNNTIQDAPVQVGTDHDWTAITAGANHSMALKADGTLWAWGQNTSGQLGLGNNSNYNTPQQVSGSNWIAINAGAEHSIAYRADGSIWSWGDNGYGQLGLGNNTNFNTPQQVSQPAIVHMFAGPEAYHTGIIKDTRSLICLAGHNDHGQLGDSSTIDKNTFNCLNECVIPGITISVAPGNSICANDTATFTASVTNGGPTPSYQWFKNNVPVGNNSDTWIANPGVLANGDQIKCVLTGSAACNVYPTDTSNIITMTVTDTVTPTITIASDLGDTICQELVATYTATITNGGPNPVYHWYENNLPVGSNSPTYVPQQVSGHTIKCVLISNAVCASPDSLASATHTLVILPVTIPQVNVTVNPGAVISQNQSVTFTANVTNATNPQYQWKKNGSNIAGETQQTYTTTTLQMGDQIACRVRGLSACDTAISAPISMTVWAVNVNSVAAGQWQLTVYPNPVKDILQIGYSNITEGKMELCDMAGKVLIKQPLSHSMDLKGLASGVYMLRVLDKASGYESLHMVVKE